MVVPARDRASVFDGLASEQHIKIEVWSSSYSNEKSMIDGENDTRTACGLMGALKS